jgi:hypothetical protein
MPATISAAVTESGATAAVPVTPPPTARFFTVMRMDQLSAPCGERMRTRCIADRARIPSLAAINREARPNLIDVMLTSRFPR